MILHTVVTMREKRMSEEHDMYIDYCEITFVHVLNISVYPTLAQI